MEEALQALKDDHEYLVAGGVFNRELIDSWIEEKMKEVIAVRNRPHPFEMNLYYSIRALKHVLCESVNSWQKPDIDWRTLLTAL